MSTSVCQATVNLINALVTLPLLPSSSEAKTALSSIVRLWIAYCDMEIGLRQFKQAVKIFEDAISDPVVSRSADIYLAYVDYCTTRNKPSNAQKVYIKGLSSQLSQQESDKLWLSFLPFIRAQGSPELTMQQLYEAVTIEAGAIVGGNTLTAPSAALLGGGAEESSSSLLVEESCVESESKSDGTTDAESDLNILNSASSTNVMAAASSSLEPDSKAHMNCSLDQATEATATIDATGTAAMDIDNSGAKEDKHAAQDSVVTDVPTSSSTPNPVGAGGVGDDLDSVIGLTPEQLTRMYARRPPMLFSAPSLEPTVFGLSALTTAETAELESFLGVPLADIQYGRRQNKVDVYLDLVEGLWTAQALKERHFDSWFTDLKKLHEKEVSIDPFLWLSVAVCQCV